jgi:tRNA-binding protein
MERPAKIKPIIEKSIIDQIDIRIGTIMEIEDIPKSERVMKLIVDFGDHKRVILAGIKKERPDPDILIGKQTLFIVNITPKEMLGEKSEGMLFDIGYADGITPVLAIPEIPVPNGTRAG